MSEQISSTNATLSAQALTLVSREFRTRQETIARQTAQRRAASESRPQTDWTQRQQSRLSERMDQLVQGKKAVSSLLTADSVNLSAPQRSVLVGRANDLQRQIDQLDGIVGGEGQGGASTALALTSKPQTEAFSSGLLRSSSIGQPLTAGTLRASAKNSSSQTVLSNLFNPPAQPISSLVDLIA